MNWARNDDADALLLDCGGLFPIRSLNRKQIAELGLKSMAVMDYSAMNLGWNELSMGTDFFTEIGSAVRLPLVTSNVVYKEDHHPYGKKYLIRKVGDVRVGILGIMPVQPLDKLPPPVKTCSQQGKDVHDDEDAHPKTISFTDQLEILRPEDALKELLPGLRKEADLVILLSQCGFEDTTSLVNKVDGIDLAISGRKRMPAREDQNSKVPVLQTAYMGKRLGFIKLTLDDSGQIAQREERMIRLDDSVPFDSRILKITSDDADKKIRDEEFQKMEKEAEEMLKMNPHEYYEKLMKEQARR